MSTWIEVARADELAVGESRAFEVRGKSIALFRRTEGWFAIDDTCSHSGASLAEGSVEDGCVLCPWHGAAFELATGARKDDIASYDLRCYPVRLAAERVEIEWRE